jgi:activator of HSP90 ATPase
MSVHFEVSTLMHAPAEKLYSAWLDSAEHSRMTGSPAQTSAEAGGAFTAWDGYISGRNLELTPATRILQAWRTVEFAETDPNSSLEILFEPQEEGTKVTIRHSNLPDHGAQYEQGWVENYFTPMKRYFES